MVNSLHLIPTLFLTGTPYCYQLEASREHNQHEAINYIGVSVKRPGEHRFNQHGGYRGAMALRNTTRRNLVTIIHGFPRFEEARTFETLWRRSSQLNQQSLSPSCALIGEDLKLAMNRLTGWNLKSFCLFNLNDIRQ